MAKEKKKAKRLGYVLERVADMEHLIKADNAAQEYSKKASRKYIERHNAHRMEDLQKLREMILTETLPTPKFRTEEIETNGKIRRLNKQFYFPWRILNQAINLIFEEDMFPMLLVDVSACIKGRGIHYQLKRLRGALRRNPDCNYFVKIDFRKYYESIPHDTILALLRKRYKDERFIRLVALAALSKPSEDDIEILLENEERNKARYHSWSRHFTADRQLLNGKGRSLDEGEIPCTLLLPIQR